MWKSEPNECENKIESLENIEIPCIMYYTWSCHKLKAEKIGSINGS